jgi:hypothetical protein
MAALRAVQDEQGRRDKTFVLTMVASLSALTDAIRRSSDAPSDVEVIRIEKVVGDLSEVRIVLRSEEYEYLAIREKLPEVNYNWATTSTVPSPVVDEPEGEERQHANEREPDSYT